MENLQTCLKMMAYSPCPMMRLYYYNKACALINNENMCREMSMEFTLADLKKYDGSTGKPAFVAVDGTVYDVSDNPAWAGGTHFGLTAGNDLTSEFESCHGGNKDVLNKMKKVGVLIK